MIHLDVETYCELDLKTVGAYRYTSHPSFMVLMAAWAYDDDPVEVTTDPEDIAELMRELWDSGETIVAHNAAFERLVMSRVLGLPLGKYLAPERFHDVMAVAAEKGWPQSLDKLSEALDGERKDSAGTRLINMFSKPNKRLGRRLLPEDKPEEWAAFVEYCRQDVVTSRDAHKALGDFPTETERQVYLVDQHINDRGMYIDVALARAAAKAAEENQIAHELRVWQITGVENPSSVQQMMAWVKSQGLHKLLPNLQAATVKAALRSDQLTAEQREALELRQELALSASKKFSAALEIVMPDGRLRGGFRFFGAHTGRWAGRGVQPHNLPREQFDNDVDMDLIIDDLMNGDGASSLDLKRLVRPMFDGPLTVVDYSAIEARVIAWLAGEEWALEAFRDGRDIYVETAERMGGLTRFQGKVAVLALGYAGGVNSLKAMAGSQEALKNIAAPPGVDVSEGEPWEAIAKRMGSPGLTMDEGLQRRVDQYRQANRRIVNLWHRLEEALDAPTQIGRHLSTTESHDSLGRAVHLNLPSGRSITYHGVRWEKYRIQTDDGPKTKESWRYADPRRGRIGTYGGRLAENATQAVARDVLAEGLMRLHRLGYDVVGHVHDEVLVAGRHDPEEIAAILTEPPSWAPDLPLGAEGFVTKRYRKG